MLHRLRNFSYIQIIALGFLATILIGTGLLCLPISSRSGMVTPFIDSLFTATSATCVTGLFVVDTWSHWSYFGQVVILLLIQIGGLGLMTVISMVFIFMRKRIGLHERRLLMQSAGTIRLSGVVRLVKQILILTLLVEGIGMLLLAIRFCPSMGLGMGLWYACFHSISAFCNAGLDLMGQFGQASFTAYSGDLLVNFTLMSLIVIGGIGFFAWNDILRKKAHFRQYELHTKIVLCTTGILILSGTVAFFLTEQNASMSHIPAEKRWLTALFQSISPRTAGFNTVDQAQLSDAGSLLTTILMLIGGSPGSTAGGMKTTTFAVLAVSMLSSIRNSSTSGLFKRQFSQDTIQQASAVGCIYISLSVLSTWAICALDTMPLKEIFFEVTSALGTVGLSMGVTAELSHPSQLILILLMYIGRVGGLSVGLALADKQMRVAVQRPTEKILIG